MRLGSITSYVASARFTTVDSAERGFSYILNELELSCAA